MPSCERHTTDLLGKGPDFTGLLRKEPYFLRCSIRASFNRSKLRDLRTFVLCRCTTGARGRQA